MSLNDKQRKVLRKMGLASKNFELISSSYCNWTFKNKKTGATLNYRF